ncbi:barstar family protein [Priestia taiwanensis]|nr:barstar family protein [Priestia taiwanensis]MBM7364093.1 RNAse (barnase) inhibitor barstar [Priestia taiwanensis]
MLQQVMAFAEEYIFTLSTLIMVIVSPLYMLMIVYSIQNRFLISVGTSVVCYVLFVVDIYTNILSDVVESWSPIPSISDYLFIFFIAIPIGVFQGNVELKMESMEEDEDGTLKILVQEEAEFCEYVEEAIGEKKKDEVCIIIDGKNCSNVRNLFREFAYKFEFPDDFNENWDEFGECMNDLYWIEEERCTVYIHNSDQLLQDYVEDFNVFMSHLGDACMTWDNEREVDGFCMVMHCIPAKEEELMAKLEVAKCEGKYVYEQELIEIIYDVHTLEGTNYIEILPGEGEIEYWSESSIFFKEEHFGYIMPAFEKYYERFDYCGINEIRIHTWNEILAELEEIKEYLMSHPNPHSLGHVVGFIYEGVEAAFMQNYAENRNQLIVMITDSQAWIEEQSKTTKVITVLGM